MSLPRLYIAPDMLPPDSAPARVLPLSEMHSHYLHHVLRMKHGMPLGERAALRILSADADWSALCDYGGER